ncbi:MAG: hypothetical protein RQ826_15820 [Xanthomonadales bacterium]|nr:hypothetical protein [Xanthomonadales bacterium]
MAENDVQRELKQLRADLSTLQSDMSALMGSLKERGSEKAAGMKSSVEDEIRHQREELRRLLNEARSSGRRVVGEAVEGIEGGVEQHPVSSLVTAFGLGFIVAKLMGLGDRH